MENNIIVLLSPSCGGKDTVAKKLNKIGYEYVISTTTRPIREGESERNPYIFTDNENFEKLIKNDELIEYREYRASNGELWYYGVETKEIDKTKSYVAVLDPVGLEGFKSFFPNSVTSIYLDAPESVRKKRCIKRGDYNKKEWKYRLDSDNKMFNEDFINKNIDYVVNAENDEYTVFEIINKRIIKEIKSNK